LAEVVFYAGRLSIVWRDYSNILYPSVRRMERSIKGPFGLNIPFFNILIKVETMAAVQYYISCR